MTPIGNQILVKPCQSESVTEGGLIIPESVQERSCKVDILKVGRGELKHPLCFHVKGAGTEVIKDGILYVIITQGDILAYSKKD